MAKKSTNKEILFLVFLLILLAVYAFYTLLLSPKINETKELYSKIETEDTQIRNMYNVTLQYGANAETVQKSKNAAKALTDHFFVRTEQELYIDIFDDMLSECDMTFREVEVEEDHAEFDLMAAGYRCLSPYCAYVPQSELEGKTPEEILEYLQFALDDDILALKSTEVEQMTFQVEAECKYSAVKELLERINAFDKYISCVKLDIDVIDDSKLFKEKDPLVLVHMDVQFTRIDKIPCLDEKENIPKFPSDFEMPMDFINGNYKKPFSFSKAVENLKDRTKKVFNSLIPH